MSDKKKHRTSNELLQYLKGETSGEERYSMEREMEADPFLKEAMEGFEQVTPEEAEEDLITLQQGLRRRRNRKRRRTWYGMAAAIASILIVGTFFLKIYDAPPTSGEKRGLLEETEPGAVPAATEQPAQSPEPVTKNAEAEESRPTSDQQGPATPQPATKAKLPDQPQPTTEEKFPEQSQQTTEKKGEPSQPLLKEQETAQTQPADKEKQPGQLQTDPAKELLMQAASVDKELQEETLPMQSANEAVRAGRKHRAREKSAPAPEPAALEPESVEIVAVEAAAAKKGNEKGEPPLFPHEISGTVVSAEDQSPLTGAFISINGTDAISVSDLEGRFSIPVSSDTQNLISARFHGMEGEKITVPDEEPIMITLQPGTLPARDESVYTIKETHETDDRLGSGLQARPPTPSGGYIAFYQYVQDNRRIPSMESAGTGGVVILMFKINALGEISEIVPVSSPGQPFTEEAIRLLKEGPSWIPAFDDSGAIDQEVILRIELK